MALHDVGIKQHVISEPDMCQLLRDMRAAAAEANDADCGGTDLAF
jgi:hypothetical protein